MAQNPFLVDQVQIEPGESGTRLINRASDGSLQFQDPSITSVVLSSLLGLRNITGVYIVGTAGDGAPYTSIQDALDEIPDSSDEASPNVILIMSGTYTENVSVTKDGVHFLGLGQVTIANDGASATITVEDSPLSTPQRVVFENLTIANDQDNTACISVQGAGTYASGTVTVASTGWSAAVLTIGGVPLTGVVGARTSGSDNFSIDGATTDIIAAEIVAAINDVANSFAVTVAASVVGSVITITAVTPGAGGNAITLVSTTTPAAGLTLSGANLTGGGSDGSRVASDKVVIRNCEFNATGNGGFQVDADTVGYIYIEGGTAFGSAGSSLIRAVNCTGLEVRDVSSLYDIEVAYDTGNDEPFYAGIGSFTLHGCRNAGDVSTNFVGAGFGSLSNCGGLGALTFGGDQAVHVRNCYVNGSITVSDTVEVKLFNSTFTGNPVNGGGTPTLDVPYLAGMTAFDGSLSNTALFTVPRSDTDYRVIIEPSATTNFSVTRATTGFDITTPAPFTGDVYWAVISG